MARKFSFFQLDGKRVRRYTFESKHQGYHIFYLYINLKENIFQIDYVSNERPWRNDVNMFYNPKKMLNELGWNLSMFNSFNDICELLDSIAFYISYNRKCPFGLKLSSRYVEYYYLESYI
jgi:hypothetical protein